MSYTLDIADAHTWLETLPDGSVDLVCIDSPYGVTQLNFDRVVLDWPRIWREVYRVCKPSAVQVCFSCQPFTTDLINSNRKNFRYDLVWDKYSPTGFLNAQKMPMRSHESILIFSQGRGTYNPQKTPRPYALRSARGSFPTNGAGIYGGLKPSSGYREELAHPKSVLPFHNGGPWDKSKHIHPTQKNLELLLWLVKTYSNPGDLVIDFFAGSGTTAHACLLTNRNFKGCELDPTFHAAATRRLEAVAAQEQLFEVAT